MKADSLPLNDKNIVGFINHIEEFFDSLKLATQNKRLLALMLEELLLQYRDNLTEDVSFSYKYRKFFGSILVELYINGKQIDLLHPQTESEEELDNFLVDHLFNTGNWQSLYRYRNGCNIISVSMPLETEKKRLPGNKMMWAIIFAVIMGALLSLLPAETQTVLCDSYISPVYSTMMSMLKGATEPVIFVSLVVGICALEDLNTMNKVGKKILLSFLLIITGMFFLAVIACLPLFGGNGGAVNFRFSELLPLLLQSVPLNYFTPFTEGNMIQIVVIGIITGITLLALGEKAGTLCKLVGELKFYFFSVLEVLVKLLPIAVFLSVVKVFLTLEIAETAVVWKLVAVDQGLNIVFVLGFAIITSLKCRVSLRLLFKKMMPIASLSFTTGSSTAVIPLFYQRLSKCFGIDEKFTGFWVPLSYAFFSPSIIFALIVFAFFATQMHGMGPGIPWLIVLYIMVIQIGMASSRIPGGIIASVTILFSQLGISLDNLGIIMGANVIILYLDSAVSSMIRCMSAVLVAKKEGALDLDVLRSNECEVPKSENPCYFP